MISPESEAHFILLFQIINCRHDMEKVNSLLKNIEDLQRELKEKGKIIFNKDIELDVKDNDVRIFKQI